MIGFWVAAGLLAAAAAVLILHRARAAAAAGPDDPTLNVYRRQLAEIDDLAARGLLAEPERKSAYAEAGKRLLAAADAGAVAWSGGAPPKALLLIAAGLAPILALALYLLLGAPGVPDQPYESRVDAWAEADPNSLRAPEMAAVLQRLVKQRPSDPDGFRFLAMAQAASGDPASAVRSLRRAIELAPQRADLWESLGEARMMQSGQVDAGAQAAFKEALRRDPRSVTARFRLAQAQIDAGERDVGLAVWRGLLAEMPADDPRRAPLSQAIASVSQPGAAVDGEQQAMIRGMVEGLAARLAQNPDDPEGWARLVRSYGVLGDTSARDQALASARARYRDDPAVLQALDEAAAAEAMR